MAKVRGIDWQFTFEEWWDAWQASGKWPQRGRGIGKYCMARFGDTGSYSLGNIKFITITANLDERKLTAGELNKCAKLTDDEIRAIREAEGKLTRTEIAEHFNINYWHVRDIQKRRCWTHI